MRQDSVKQAKQKKETVVQFSNHEPGACRNSKQGKVLASLCLCRAAHRNIRDVPHSTCVKNLNVACTRHCSVSDNRLHLWWNAQSIRSEIPGFLMDCLCPGAIWLRLPTWLAPLRNSAGMSLRSKADDRNMMTIVNAVWKNLLGLPTPCLGRLSGVLVQLGCDVIANAILCWVAKRSVQKEMILLTLTRLLFFRRGCTLHIGGR